MATPHSPSSNARYTRPRPDRVAGLRLVDDYLDSQKGAEHETAAKLHEIQEMMHAAASLGYHNTSSPKTRHSDERPLSKSGDGRVVRPSAEVREQPSPHKSFKLATDRSGGGGALSWPKPLAAGGAAPQSSSNLEAGPGGRQANGLRAAVLAHKLALASQQNGAAAAAAARSMSKPRSDDAQAASASKGKGQERWGRSVCAMAVAGSPKKSTVKAAQRWAFEREPTHAVLPALTEPSPRERPDESTCECRHDATKHWADAQRKLELPVEGIVRICRANGKSPARTPEQVRC